MNPYRVVSCLGVLGSVVTAGAGVALFTMCGISPLSIFFIVVGIVLFAINGWLFLKARR